MCVIIYIVKGNGDEIIYEKENDFRDKFTT